MFVCALSQLRNEWCKYVGQNQQQIIGFGLCALYAIGMLNALISNAAC